MNNWQFTNVAWLYLASAVIAFILAYKSWKMRPVRGTLLFSMLVFFVGLWSLSYLVGFFNTDVSVKLIALRFDYLGIIGAVFFWLMFVFSYSNLDNLLKPKFVLPLMVIPIITLLEVIFINMHDYFYESYHLDKYGELIILAKEYGIGFFLWAIYAYSGLVAGALLLINSLLRMPEKYQKQSFPIGAAVVVLLFPNFLYLSGSKIFGPYDATPISFVIVGVIFICLMRKYKFLDIVPVAHEMTFDNVKSGIIITDSRNQILEMNAPAQRLLNCSLGDTLGKQVVSVFPDLKEILDSGNHENQKIELRVEHGKRTYEIRVTNLADRMGKSVGKVIMFYDISDLRNALDELEAYAHTVAHDLKNPLAAIRGFSELILNEDLPEEDKRESLQAISESSEKLLIIVDSLLLLSSTRRQGEIELSTVDLNNIVDNVLSRLQYVIKEQNVKIKLPESFPTVLGYAPWIEEVCMNYISNAIKYGGKPPVVELIAAVENGKVRLEVKDNGAGLSPDEQAKLFTEYSRLKQHEATKTGHGLGLSIVKRIVEKLDGEVGVTSEEGKGSSFYFTLPKGK